MENSQKNLLLFVLISGLVIGLSILSLAGFRVAIESKKCAGCHEILPEYRTWEVSSHSKVKCINCHITPGIVGLTRAAVNIAFNVGQHYTGDFQRPIKNQLPVNSAACEKCHSYNREISPSGDLIVPHDRHRQQKVPCATCHRGVAHGDIAARSLTAQGDFIRISNEITRLETSGNTISMGDCLNCHEQRGVTTKCSACHKNIQLPESHTFQGWATTHGVEARRHVDLCIFCHGYGAVAQKAQRERKLDVYVKNGRFCISCHRTKPATHRDAWVPTHGSLMDQRGIQNCLTCHFLDKPKEKDANPVYCNKCHASYATPLELKKYARSGKI